MLRIVLTFRERSSSFLRGRTEGRIIFYLHKKKERIQNARNFLLSEDRFDKKIFAGIVKYHRENMINPVITRVKVESIVKSISCVHPEDKYVITSLYYI